MAPADNIIRYNVVLEEISRAGELADVNKQQMSQPCLLLAEGPLTLSKLLLMLILQGTTWRRDFADESNQQV
jgi:hypothetical protein